MRATRPPTRENNENADVERADEEEERPDSNSSSSSGDVDAKDSGLVHTDEKGQERQPAPELDWPDGGLKAWGNILGCTLISITAFGASILTLLSLTLGS